MHDPLKVWQDTNLHFSSGESLDTSNYKKKNTKKLLNLLTQYQTSS